MLMLISVIIILSVSFILNYYFFKDIAYPPLLQNFLWLIVLILMAIFETDFSPVSDEVYLAVAYAVIGFTIGGALMSSQYSRIKIKIKITPEYSYLYALKVLTIIAIILFPLFLTRIYYIAGESLSIDFFYRLREALVNDDGKNMFGIGYYFYFCVILFAFKLIATDKVISWGNLFYFILPLIVAFLFVAKGFVLFLMSSAVGVILIQRKVNIRKFIFFSMVIFALLIILLISLRQVNPENSDTGVFSIVKIYFLAGLPALTQLLQHGENGSGENVFRNVFVWLNRFGFDLPIIPLVQEFVNVPFGTNVYTYLRLYMLDFGLIGVFVFNIFFGWINGFVYAKAQQGSAAFIVIYGLLLCSLIMQFFDDQYFQILSLWVYMSIFIFLFFKISKYTMIKMDVSS